MTTFIIATYRYSVSFLYAKVFIPCRYRINKILLRRAVTISHIILLFVYRCLLFVFILNLL